MVLAKCVTECFHALETSVSTPDRYCRECSQSDQISRCMHARMDKCVQA